MLRREMCSLYLEHQASNLQTVSFNSLGTRCCKAACVKMCGWVFVYDHEWGYGCENRHAWIQSVLMETVVVVSWALTFWYSRALFPGLASIKGGARGMGGSTGKRTDYSKAAQPELLWIWLVSVRHWLICTRVKWSELVWAGLCFFGRLNSVRFCWICL